MAIYGIGTDICDIRRMAASLQRHGERFAARILTPAEMQQWRERTRRHPQRGLAFLATRFAAKEAVSKALGLGMRMPMGWQHCEIVRSSGGQPLVRWLGPLRPWCEARQLSAHISLSDERDYASAFCVVERASPGPGGGHKPG